MQGLFGIARPRVQPGVGIGSHASMEPARRMVRRLFDWPRADSRVTLRADACMTLRVGKGHTLLCKRGVAWVTQLGLRDDFVLRPGQTLRTTGRGSVVVTAVEALELVIARRR